jgi:genome maintenance exonuclease 1
MAVGDEEASRVSSRASQRGTRFHNIVESYLRSDNLDFGKNILLKEQFRLFKPILNRVSNIRGLEYPLYSDILKLAGTCDCIASFDGVPSVIDWKTSNNLKSLHEIENYWLQLTIYSLMIEERYGLHLPQIVICISVDSMKPQVFKGIRNDWFPLLAKRIKQSAH